MICGSSSILQMEWLIFFCCSSAGDVLRTIVHVRAFSIWRYLCGVEMNKCASHFDDYSFWLQIDHLLLAQKVTSTSLQGNSKWSAWILCFNFTLTKLSIKSGNKWKLLQCRKFKNSPDVIWGCHCSEWPSYHRKIGGSILSTSVLVQDTHNSPYS